MVMSAQPRRDRVRARRRRAALRARGRAPLVALKQRILRELGLSTARSSATPRGRRLRAHRSRVHARWVRVRAPAGGGEPARADVVVIGGGPAGASAAAILAENGRSVIVLEREPFPRYHVGRVALARALGALGSALGVSEQIEAAGFVEKQGIRFARRDDPDDVVLLTAEYPSTSRAPTLHHVDRARFDALLLDNARRKGARRARGLVGVPTSGRPATG